MLCCVSRRTVSGADQVSLYDHYLTKVQPVESEKVVEVEKGPEPDVPPILQPCAICARTFKPQTLEKHTRICEQTASKKRKPFDSAKQRIQGTELAEFLPRQEKRRYTQDDRTGGHKSTWKQTHDDFLRQIRAARNEIENEIYQYAKFRQNLRPEDRVIFLLGVYFAKHCTMNTDNSSCSDVSVAPKPVRGSSVNKVDDTMQKQGTTVLSSSAPLRANEQGVCPTCNRHFGVKAYDRHVAWCKDRIARVQISPATNIAKERLEARMKYRAPSLKNRRQITREKYSPASATNLHSSNKTSPTQHTNRAKESVSAPNCNKANDSPNKQKPAVVRRTGQSKGASSPIGPMKSRPIDRSNRPPEDGSGLVTFPPAPPNKRTLLPVPPLKYKKQSLEEYNIVSSPKHKLHTRKMAKREQPPSCRAKPKEGGQPLLSGRSLKSNIVSARSEGHPKLNDISINVDVLGMTVTPCDLHPKTKLTTWKKLSQEKVQWPDTVEKDERVSSYKSTGKDGHFLGLNVQEKEPAVVLDSSLASKLSSRSGSGVNWRTVTPRLNRTYSFKDSFEDINDLQLRNLKRKPVKNSPRIEFRFGDIEKLERLRSHYQRKMEEEKKTDKGASKVPKDSLEALSCEEKDWKGSRMSTGSIKSARARILEKKRLNLSCDQFPRENQNEEERPHSTKMVYPENNTLIDSIGNTCNDLKNKIDDTKDENFPGEKIPSPIVGEQFNVSEELHELEECRKDVTVNDSVSERLSRGKYRSETADIRKVREENDVNRASCSFITDEFEFPAEYNDDIAMFCDIEAKLIEMECQPVLMKNVLRPSRSSTPFDNLTNWKELESLREKSITPPENKWEMSINDETAAEVLYRVEVEETDLSRQNNIDESKGINIQNSDCLTATRYIDNRPSIAPEEEEMKVPVIDKKDIASQATICKCSPQVGDPAAERSIDDNNSSRDESVKNSGKINEVIFGMQVADLRRIEPPENQSPKESDHDYKEDNIDTNPIIETIKIADDEVQEIYKNSSTKDFDCPSDDSVDENEMPESRCTYKTSVRNDLIDVRNLRSMILSESHVTVKKSANAAFKSRYSKVIGIENRILEHVDEMNDSNDSLSLIDGVDLAGVKQVETVEVETIEEIGTGSRNVRFDVLPDIKRTTIVVKKDRNKSETITTETYWEKAPKATKNRLINLDLPYQGSSRLLKRNPKVLALPPVSSSSSLMKRSGKDYNPFLLAEQQMNDLLSDASEQSVTDSPLLEKNRENSYPLSHSSAFVKYPCPPSNPGKRSSLIAPPIEFDDLASDFSSDSTETNSLCREVYLKDDKESKSNFEKKSPVRELGRRVIIDKSKALGGNVTEDNDRGSRSFVGNSDRARKILDKVSPKVVRPTVNRSFSVRASSAPKTTLDKNNISSNDTKKSSSKNNDQQSSSNTSLNNKNNNYMNLSTSNLSLSSIVSSDVDIKRSNSVFDELMTSFDDENSSFTSLKSLLKSDSLSVSSPVRGRQRNDQNSDEELSSPESYKRQDHGKFSGDSAYSSLNRKYSHHGRSTNDVAGRLDEDHMRQHRGRSDGECVTASSKCKMSKFCHECGSKFPETAKFCCECGIRRLVL